MKPSQLKLSKQFDLSYKSYGWTVSYLSGVWGGAPVANDFSVIHSKKKKHSVLY